MACLALVWYSNIRASVENSCWVRHTDDVFLEISGTLPAIADAEGTSHGYIIAGEDSRRESFQSALSRVTEHLDNLKQLISDNPRQRERVPAIEPRIVDRLKLLQEAVDLEALGRHASINLSALAARIRGIRDLGRTDGD